jgi:hypothetical protein
MSDVNIEATRIAHQFLQNSGMSRQQIASILDGDYRDLDKDCGYPAVITAQMYQAMFDREGIADRVVSIMAEESWALDPQIYESEDTTQTTFEKEFNELNEAHDLFAYMEKADVLSGIGRYGVLLFGLNDGKTLIEPVEGIDLKTGEATGTPPKNREVLFIRAFPESSATVVNLIADAQSPLYGQPEFYDLLMDNTDAQNATSGTTTSTVRVHWTRIIHVANTLKTASEVFAAPIMRNVYNRLIDLRKILGGSAEMLWQGGFPGLNFTMNDELAARGATIDTDSLDQQMSDYANSLKRYIATKGGSVSSLATQVADPTQHFEVCIRAVCLTIGVPYRLFLGSEQAQLASSQDKKTHNGRVAKRQRKYVGPKIVRPVINRLIAYGVLPDVASYFLDWADLDALSTIEQAEVFDKRAGAIAKYVTSGSATLIPPLEFLTEVAEFNIETAQAILEAAAANMPDPDDDTNDTLPGTASEDEDDPDDDTNDTLPGTASEDEDDSEDE